MTAIRRVAVIDIGKTNAKVALYDLKEGGESLVHSRPNTIIGTGPYPHHDVEALWRFILAALKDIGARAPIDAISITSHGASVTLVDAEGNLALPMLDYEHDGPDRLKADYDAVRPDFSETGSPRLPAGLNVGAQLFWLARSFPAEFSRVTSIMTYPQYWAMRLTGRRASEATSLGAHTDLWNPYQRDFSTLVERMGWRPLFPRVGSPFDVAGRLKPEVAAATGLPADTPVISGIHDSNASLLTHLAADDPPFSVVSTGTWVICFSVGGGAVALDEARDTLANVNAFGDPVPSARFMGGRTFAMLKADAAAGITASDRDAVLDGRIMLLPSIPEDSGPFMGRVGAWKGDAASLTPGGHLYAVSLHLGLMTSVSLELIGAAGPVIVEGPLARNVTFLEAIGVATGRAVMTGGGATGTSAGAALLALGRGARTGRPATVATLLPDPRITAYAAEWRRLVDHG